LDVQHTAFCAFPCLCAYLHMLVPRFYYCKIHIFKWSNSTSAFYSALCLGQKMLPSWYISPLVVLQIHFWNFWRSGVQKILRFIFISLLVCTCIFIGFLYPPKPYGSVLIFCRRYHQSPSHNPLEFLSMVVGLEFIGTLTCWLRLLGG
jgi:hypothetical protein